MQALAALLEVEEGRPVAEALAGAERGLSPEDRRLATQIVYAVLRHRRFLDAFITTRIPRSPKAAVRMVIRIGLCQLWFMDRVPDYAVVSSAVEQARTVDARAAGLVNAVLRTAIRTPFEPREPGVRYSLPDWILERWQARWPGDWETMAARLNEPPPMTLRVRKDRATALADLASEGVEAVASDWLPDAITVRSPLRLERSALFRQGFLYVQDQSAMAVTYAAAEPEQTRIVDLCAGVGGKSFHLADQHPTAHVTAVDTAAERLARLRENAVRLHLAGRVTPVLGDARAVASQEHGGIVIVDAPCTGLGILRRRPDIRWRRQPRDLARFQILQRELLDAAVGTVEPGGIVVYSVCSTEPEETTVVVNAILQAHSELVPEDVAQLLPEPWTRFREGHWLLVPPGIADLDGFFIARLRRTA